MTEVRPIIAQPLVVTPKRNTKLASLHAEYAIAKAAADEAAACLKGITDAIKLELTQAAPDEQKITLTYADSAAGVPSLSLTYSESWRVDAKRLKAEDPETYVRYAKKSGSWTLRTVPSAGGDAS